MKLEYKKIISFIREQDYKTNNGIGLHTGVPGTILLMALDYLITNDARNVEKIDTGLDFCIESVKQDKNNLPILSGGVAGFTWVVNFLIGHGIIDPESEEILHFLDSVLEAQQLHLLDNGFTDLLNGAMGIGIYFMERKNFKAVERIVEYLYQNKISYGNQFLWTVDKKNPNEELIFDFGLAHGAAGVLYFLLKCFELRIQPIKVRELINGLLNFFDQNVQEFDLCGSYYPNFINVEAFKNGTYEPSPSRLAWCYGDLGILHTLYNASLLLNDNELGQKTIEKLLITSSRRNSENTRIEDAGFCHGTAGAAFLFHDLFMKTHLVQFKSASNFWIEKTLEMNKNNNGNVPEYDFSTSYNADDPGISHNLIDGLVGVGVTYNFMINQDFPSNVKNILMLM